MASLKNYVIDGLEQRHNERYNKIEQFFRCANDCHRFKKFQIANNYNNYSCTVNSVNSVNSVNRVSTVSTVSTVRHLAWLVARLAPDHPEAGIHRRYLYLTNLQQQCRCTSIIQKCKYNGKR